MTGPRIRLLVVDDSNFVRIALRKMLEPASDIEIVGEARNGAEALRLSRKLKPHVVAMDLNMPIMDGIESVQAIAAEKGPPCIMVSNETSEGADATIRALETGAVDFVCKHSSFITFDMASIERQLTEKVRHWGRWRMALTGESVADAASVPAVEPAPEPMPEPVPKPIPPLRSSARGHRPDLVVVGVSTGGPVALVELLGALAPLPCPLVVAQHMPASFTAGFAASLTRSLGRTVEEGGDGAVLVPGAVTILRGGADWTVRRGASGRFTLHAADPAGAIYHPSADRLFRSAAESAESPVAVVLTGMGDDGSAGAAAFAERRLPVLVQDPVTCAVDGMPKAAIRAGVATEVLPVAAIARKLNALFTLA
ncbi:two-component response regulator modulated CheB methylesterase [Azospirillum sp. B510]|uniref:chemotaxis-specific protein-glutamate methyltransferase CheB n=1 Tax=Azospirillum sp. (strain B510) TaxID=137722 RepID=UPI0001C4BF55|nr:chemotaxis-specific protein-glutamate methyltransferase CheB [Azospirillum sp. B510]BAI72303.1 two-component response regulator modulated CheB methylesterase [Azospirillum sp. B510]